MTHDDDDDDDSSHVTIRSAISAKHAVGSFVSMIAVRIRFDSTVMGRCDNFRIGRVCPLLVVVRRLKRRLVVQYTDSLAL